MKNLKQRLLLVLKGAAMGAADVVPGVSGGTVAFITGIYRELIETISGINIAAFRTLFKEGVPAFWKAINGNFILALGVGMLLSIITLARIISDLLQSNPVAVWAFFFGLVAASIPLVARRAEVWNAKAWFTFGLGAVAAFLVTELPVVEDPGADWYLFISGAVAICAMILPGVSGSFILLLMGSYLTVLDAVNDRDFLKIAVFAAGAVFGLLSFSRMLKWMFNRYHDLTIAVLSGFLLGSLNKIWPWKNPLQSVVKHPGTDREKVVILEEEKVWPWNYFELTGGDAILFEAVLLCLAGIAVIFAVDRLAAVKR